MPPSPAHVPAPLYPGRMHVPGRGPVRVRRPPWPRMPHRMVRRAPGDHRGPGVLPPPCRRRKCVASLDDSLAVSLPDLDNRAPSLVGWVSRQIDGDVLAPPAQRAEVGERWPARGRSRDPDLRRHRPAASLGAGVAARQSRRHRSSGEHPGRGARRHHDYRQGRRKHVEQLVPPWIEHRVRGEAVAPDEDRKEREDFYQRVLDSIERGLGHERDLSSYMAEGRLSAPQGGAGA